MGASEGQAEGWGPPYAVALAVWAWVDLALGGAEGRRACGLAVRSFATVVDRAWVRANCVGLGGSGVGSVDVWDAHEG
jgi:hypothetical protein